MLFQVSYKANNKTFYSDIEANHYNDVIAIFDKLIGAEITEIREYVYVNNVKKKFDDVSISNRKVILKIYNENHTRSEIKLPMLKSNIKQSDILNIIQNTLKVDDKPLIKIDLKYI